MENLNIINQLSKHSLQGFYGKEAQTETKNVNKFNNTLDGLIYNIQSYFEKREEKEIAFVKDYFTKTLILTFLKTYKINIEVANNFLSSIISDYPNIENTALTLRLNDLLDASYNMKKVSTIKDYSLVWKQMLNMLQSYNE